MTKNVMKEFDFDAYADLWERARSEGVFVMYDFNQNHPWGGVSIAWKRCGVSKNHKMVEVAVAYCSKHDPFTKKIGSMNVLSRFFNTMETITIPIGDVDSAIIVNRLRFIFSSRFNPAIVE